MGWLLVEQLLLVIKHNGAVDKAEIGLCALASKLLGCVCACVRVCVCMCVCACVRM